MEFVFPNGAVFEFVLFFVEERYGSCRDYVGQPCHAAAHILQVLIERLEFDSHDRMIDKDPTFSGVTTLPGEWRAKLQSNGQAVIKQATPQKAFTHNSVCHFLWRRFKLHLVAAKKCGSSHCTCWHHLNLEPVESTSFNPEFIMKPIFLSDK
jgi:hypothetical protein